MDVAANFTLILAHLALCLHSFGVRTHLKRTLSSGARTGGSAGLDEGTDSVKIVQSPEWNKRRPHLSVFKASLCLGDNDSALWKILMLIIHMSS